MQVYKLRPSHTGEKELLTAAFEKDTKKIAPWYQTENGKERHFAVCPACDNPIRIVGLYDPLPHTDRPYGKHCEKKIPGFPYFDPSAFDWCPYLAKNTSGTVRGRRPLNEVSVKILGIVLAQFDRVVHLLRKDLGFRMLRKQAQQMLTHWLEAEGYLYRDATLRNIPWMVAYRTRGLNLYGQPVQEPALREAIEHRAPGLEVEPDGRIVRTDQKYHQLMWCCVDHQFRTKEGVLEETMEFVVWSDHRNNVIHRKTISFEPQYFDNLLNLPADRAKRDPALLADAQEIFRHQLAPTLLQDVKRHAAQYGYRDYQLS